MKKIFTRGLCICMVAALLVNIAVTAFIQMLVSGQNSRTDSHETLESVKERLAENDKNIAELTKPWEKITWRRPVPLQTCWPQTLVFWKGKEGWKKSWTG